MSPKRSFTWTKKSEQAKLLADLITSGEAFEASPIDLYQKYELFQKATPPVFRAHLNKAKSGKGGSNLNRDTTVNVPPPSTSPTVGATLADDTQHEYSYEDDNASFIEDGAILRATFQQDNVGCSSSDPTAVGTLKKRKASVLEGITKREKWNFAMSAISKNYDTGVTNVDFFILLPTGLNSNQQYAISVADEGLKLVLLIFFPKSFSDPEILSKIARINNSSMSEVHQIRGSLTDHINTMRDNINDPVQKEFEIEVPMKVQQEIVFIKASETKEGAKIVHVRLKGITDSFSNKTRDDGEINVLDF